MDNYYFPIDSKCLGYYFGWACIIPSRYFPNKPSDIQNKLDEFLLITTYIGSKETDCCFELILTNDEIKELIEIKKGFYLLQKPLPITRVRYIYFTNKIDKEVAITNVTMSTAFIPEKIIKVIEKFDDQKISFITEVPKIPPIVEWSEKIKSFESLLGGFALLRLGGEEYMNYSENYFSTLAEFNSVIQDELNFSKKTFDNLFRSELYQRLKSYIKKDIDETDLYELAKKENQTISKNSIGSIDINKLDYGTYILAILNYYGVGAIRKQKNVDDLILTNFKDGIKLDKSELIALCYGINRGYSAFTKKYKNNNKEKIVKFELNSLLDYYTIESVYQYCINNIQKNNEFPYLDKLFPRLPDENILNKSDYRVMDVIVRGKKKPKKTTLEIFTEKFRTFFQEYFGIKSWENIYRQFEKQDLEKFVSEIKEEIIDELRSQIEEDLNLKYQKQLYEIRNDYNKEKSKLFLLLRKCDETLFDEIDKNKNGILEFDEVSEFLIKLRDAKNLHIDQIKIDDEIHEKEVKYNTKSKKNQTKKKVESNSLQANEPRDNLSGIANLEITETKKNNFAEITIDDANPNAIKASVNVIEENSSLANDNIIEGSVTLTAKEVTNQTNVFPNNNEDNFSDYIKRALDSALNLIPSHYIRTFKEHDKEYDDSKSLGENIINLHNIPVDVKQRKDLAELLTAYSASPKDGLQNIAKGKQIPYKIENNVELVLSILNKEKENNHEDYIGQDQSLFS